MLNFEKYISESLWANIAAKRARGERPAKPGEKGYPKTLGVKEEIDEGDTGYKPGWMLKKDPELAKKVKDKIDLAKKRQASYGNPAAGKSVKEETELQELSNDTLKSYAKKAGAEATGVKGKHLSREKSNKRFYGFAKAVKRLTKEDADQLDELSKETLGSYKHKAELSIPADDREYKNRSKGIDRAEKKLKEEIVAEGAVKDLMMDLRVMPAKEFEAKYKMTKAKARAEMRPSSVAEATGDKHFDTIMSAIKKGTSKQATADRQAKKADSQQRARDAFGPSPAAGLGIRKPSVKEETEQLDELSPNLLHRYVKKAAGNMGMHAVDHGKYGDQQKDKKSINKAAKRLDGITNASARMADKANRYDESEINDLAAEYINENNITLEELENMTEEELNELIGAAVGGAFKLGAKAVVGAGRLAGRAVNRMSTSGRADAAEKKASTLEKKNADRERIRAAQDRLRKAKEAANR